MSHKKWTVDTDPSADEQWVCNSVFKTTLNEESDMNGLAEIQSYLGSCTEIRTKLEINIYAVTTRGSSRRISGSLLSCVWQEEIMFQDFSQQQNIGRICLGAILVNL